MESSGTYRSLFELFGYLRTLLMIRVPSMKPSTAVDGCKKVSFGKSTKRLTTEDTKGINDRGADKTLRQLFERLTEHMLEAMPTEVIFSFSAVNHLTTSYASAGCIPG